MVNKNYNNLNSSSLTNDVKRSSPYRQQIANAADYVRRCRTTKEKHTTCIFIVNKVNSTDKHIAREILYPFLNLYH